MKKSLIYSGLLMLAFGFIVSCEEEPNYPDTSQYKTVITSIKIVNGGLSGTETIVGKVDEDKKEISFPEVHENSDLSKIKFEIETIDERAHLDSVEYNFVVPEGQSERVRTIKLVNSTRFREYYVTIRLDVPVWGADFTPSKVKVYDYSKATLAEGVYAAGSIDKEIYNTAAEYGRQYGISLDNVLIINRINTVSNGGPILVKMSDIKEGNVGTFTTLTGSDIATEPWYAGGGLITNGHVYVSNGTPWGNTFYIRCWEEDKPNVAPQVMSYQYPVEPRRYDGFLSGHIDAAGDGYFFVSGNANVPTDEKLLRASVTGFSTLTEVKLLPGTSPLAGSWAAFNHVPGTVDEYLYSGRNSNQAPIKLMNSNAGVLYTIPIGDFAQTSADAKIIVFNQERYFMVMDESGKFNVFNITLGATTQEALGLLDKTKPLFTYELGAAIPTGNAAISTAWVADGDDTLYLIAGGVQAGFAVFEIPKKVKEPKE